MVKKVVEEGREEKSKVARVAVAYYARKDIQKAMFEFCKNRETIPRYGEGFGKRPDCFDYPNDVFVGAKKGATSFHCSEELWQNPLSINTNMTPEEYNEIKIGWDFLIDIDSKYLDYSKLAAQFLIRELENHGVTNIGIKFSGSKGFHIIVPFKAFPHEFNGEATKDKFPEWPRHIAQYLFKRIKGPLNAAIMQLTSTEKLKETGELITTNTCPRCGGMTIKKTINIYRCPNFQCRTEMKSMKSNKKELLCPSCNGKMQKVEQEVIDYCESCKMNSATLAAERSEVRFLESVTTKSAEDAVDIVLVASRHLFRAPYSLHEKTALASVVLTKEEVAAFTLGDADPLKITEPRSYMPQSQPHEARDLLAFALENVTPDEQPIKRKYDGKPLDVSGLTITEDMFPPVIKTINKGIERDGRKRALYILLSFYNALEFPQEYIQEKIDVWNTKNKVPLKRGYITSQIAWFEKRKPMPPNYTNPIYKEFGVTTPPEPGMKNPINYTIKRALKKKARDESANKKADGNDSV